MTTTLEPIYVTAADKSRELAVAGAVQQHRHPNVTFTGTTEFYPTDFQMTAFANNKRGTYIGDLEVKWLNHSSTERTGMFNNAKFDRLMLMEQGLHLWNIPSHCYIRIAVRYTDGILLFPARELMDVQPEFKTRPDTNETDLVRYIPVDRLRNFGYWIDVKVDA